MTSASVATPQCVIRLKRPHAEQLRFIKSSSPRRVIRAGRRSGKTTGLAIYAVQEFLKGERILYAVPTAEQVMRFWAEVSQALAEPIQAGVFHKNETLHIIEKPGTEQRIRAKTAWSADTLRGDFCTRLILDEWQLCNEDAWSLVGAPMMLDRPHSIAIFCYTPPSFRSAGITKAHDPRHAAKLFKAAAADTSGRWSTHHFTSHANPHISRQALDEITEDMSTLGYTQEILAQDIEDVPGALWTQSLLDRTRLSASQLPDLPRVVIALDPAGTSQATADEMGIVAGGRGADGHGYLLRDASRRGTPEACARDAILLYDRLEADVLIGEANNGGEWIGTVIALVAAEMHRQGARPMPTVHYKMVHASRNKQTRAEPVATEYAHDRVHNVGWFPQLEGEMCLRGSSLIATADGLRRLDEVHAGDLVWTSQGLRPVLWAGCTQIAAEVCEISTASNMNLVGTLLHPVYHIGLQQFVSMGMLQTGDLLEEWAWSEDGKRDYEAWMDLQGGWESMALNWSGKGGSGLCDETATTTISKSGCSTLSYGARPMAPFLGDILSTTRTTIGQIMSWRISNSRPILSTNCIMAWPGQRQQVLRNEADEARQIGHGYNPMKLSASNVKPSFFRDVPVQNTVPKSAVVVCTGVERLRRREPAYNLTLPPPHDYYANGIRVHNCGWVPGMPSPSRMDAAVWCFTELLLNQPRKVQAMEVLL